MSSYFHSLKTDNVLYDFGMIIGQRKKTDTFIFGPRAMQKKYGHPLKEEWSAGTCVTSGQRTSLDWSRASVNGRLEVTLLCTGTGTGSHFQMEGRSKRKSD